MLPALTLGVLLLLQSAPAPAADRAAAITLDFLATGSDGGNVPGLTAGEVTLKIGGKVRPIRTLELVPAAERGRVIFLLVDEATLYALEPVVKDAVRKLLASLKPWDRIGYVSTRGGRITPPSTNQEPVIKAVEAMKTGPGVLHTCLTDMLRAIEQVARALPRGRSSSLLVLSRGAGNDPAFGTSDAAGCTPRSEPVRRAADVISATQINLHLLTVDELSRSWGLDTLAANTSGLAGLVTWADTGALERAAASTSSYYRVTFAPDASASDRPQRIEVEVARPNVRVRTAASIHLRPPAGK